MQIRSIVVMLCLGLTAAACGNSTSRTNSSNAVGVSATKAAAGVASAEAQLKLYSAPSHWVAPGPGFDATKVRGKSIWYIAGDYSATPTFALMVNGMKAALAPLHDSVYMCDGGGVPTGYVTCMNEALAAGASAIVAGAIPSSTIAPEIAKANSEHVPVVLALDRNDTTPAPPGVAAVVSFPYTLLGQLDADWVIANSAGKANVFVVNVTGSNPALEASRVGSIPTLNKLCPECTVTVRNVPLANLPEVASLTTTVLQSNPKITYIIGSFDAVAGLMVPSIQQLGDGNRIKIATFNGSLQEMQMMAQGSPIKMDIATAGPAIGYAAADQVLRLLSGVVASKRESAPVRVFTQSTVRSLSLTQAGFASDVWFNAKISWLHKFWALWGVKS